MNADSNHQNARAEYLTSDEGQGNRGKYYPSFKLSEVEFRATVDATRAVLTDPALRRAQGAKALWQYYLEFSFDPACGGLRPGVIFSPITWTAQRLQAKRDSIVKWKRLLVDRGWIWIEKFRQECRRPWEIINVSCLVPKTDQGDLFQPPPYPHFQALVSQYLRWRPSPQNGTAPSPQNGTAPSPQNGTAPSPQNGNPPSPQTGNIKKGSRSKERGERGNGSLEASAIYGSLTGDSKAQKASPVHQPKAEGRKTNNQDRENDFMLLCRETFDQDTSREWGGYWRTLFRQNPAKAERVIAAVRDDLKTKHIRNVGGYAMDLWKRFA